MPDLDPYDLPRVTDEACCVCLAPMLEDLSGLYCDQCGHLVEVIDNDEEEDDFERLARYDDALLLLEEAELRLPADQRCVA